MASSIQCLANFLGNLPVIYKDLVCFGVRKPWKQLEGSFKEFVAKNNFVTEPEFTKDMEILETGCEPMREFKWIFNNFTDGGQISGDLIRVTVLSIMWRKGVLEFLYQISEVYYPSREGFDYEHFMKLVHNALNEDGKNRKILMGKKLVEASAGVVFKENWIPSEVFEDQTIEMMLADPSHDKIKQLFSMNSAGDRTYSVFAKKTPEKLSKTDHALNSFMDTLDQIAAERKESALRETKPEVKKRVGEFKSWSADLIKRQKKANEELELMTEGVVITAVVHKQVQTEAKRYRNAKVQTGKQ